jgi:hypothetical protein
MRKNENKDIVNSKKIMKPQCLCNITEADKRFDWKYLRNDDLSAHTSSSLPVNKGKI